MQQQNSAPHKRTKYLIIFAFLLAAYVIYPYSTLYRLSKGLEEGNKETLRSLVNWENLRTSIKDELNASLSADLMKKQDHKATGFEGLGTALVATFLPKMIDGMIDSIVTPAGLAKMIGNAKSREPDAPEKHTESNHEGKKETNNIIKQIRYAFFSDLATFRVEFGNKSDTPNERVVAMLVLQNGNWKLDSISLPETAQSLSRNGLNKNDTKAKESNRIGKSSKPVASAQSKLDTSTGSVGKALKTLPKLEPKQKSQQKNPSTPMKRERPDIANKGDASIPLTISELNAIRDQFIKCWNAPAGARDLHNMTVALLVRLQPNGSVTSVEMAGDNQRYHTDNLFRAAADSAIRAVKLCSPLHTLPNKNYENWKEIKITFNPTDLLY